MPYGQSFAIYFYGIIELTNVPLTIVDIFKYFPHLAKAYPLVNDMARYSFAVSFFVLRLSLWPYFLYSLWVVCIHILFDPNPKYPSLTVMILIVSIILTYLQYFWGYKIVYFVIKTLGKSNSVNKE